MKPPRRNRQPSRKMTHPGSKPANSRGTYKVRNEIVTKRNETKRNQQKRNETKRNQRNENEIKRNQRKQNEINENKTK
jgi:hypothetical protein